MVDGARRERRSGDGRYKRSFRSIRRAMIILCPTSRPLMPARMLMLFGAKMEMEDM